MKAGLACLTICFAKGLDMHPARCHCIDLRSLRSAVHQPDLVEGATPGGGRDLGRGSAHCGHRAAVIIVVVDHVAQAPHSSRFRRSRQRARVSVEAQPVDGLVGEVLAVAVMPHQVLVATAVAAAGVRCRQCQAEGLAHLSGMVLELRSFGASVPRDNPTPRPAHRSDFQPPRRVGAGVDAIAVRLAQPLLRRDAGGELLAAAHGLRRLRGTVANGVAGPTAPKSVLWRR